METDGRPGSGAVSDVRQEIAEAVYLGARVAGVDVERFLAGVRVMLSCMDTHSAYWVKSSLRGLP